MRRMMPYLLVATCMLPTLAAAQQQEAPPAPAPTAATGDAAADDTADEPDIIVQGSRNLPGAVIGDIPPEEQLGPADIRSYGVSSVADLLDELAPQTGSIRGQGGAPVTLLNGRRIASFAEIRDIPTEAIARVDILPEEVALKYGYRADQKVVNIVLRRRFRAVTLEAADRLATEGGRNVAQGEADLLRIRRDHRVNLHFSYQDSSRLTEAERDISPVATDDIDGIDQRPFRTLLPASTTFGANAIYARPIGKVNATVNARLDTSDTRGLFGLPTTLLTVPAGSPFARADAAETIGRALGDFAPLAQRSRSTTAHLGTTLNGDIGSWRWSLLGNYDRVTTRSTTDTGVAAGPFQTRLDALDPLADPFGPLLPADFPGTQNRARSVSTTAGLDALFNGSLARLPAGQITTSIRIGADTSDLDSRSLRAGLEQRGAVSRDSVNGQLNLDVPIASRAENVLGALGTLSANFNIAADRLSDFGTQTTLGYGANWSPVAGVRIIASVTDRDRAPSAAQLGNAVVVTPNVRIFDYVAGETATVTTVSGGNRGLVADSSHTAKLGLTLKPWSSRNLVLTANYVTTRTDDPIAAFPTPTAAIEAAFPGRFTRDADGRLQRVDLRPINFARRETSQMRWGLNLSVPLKSKVQKELEAFRAGTGPNPFAGLRRRGREAPAASGEAPAASADAQRPRRFGGGGRGGFGGGRGGRGQGGGRLQFALFHTWHFTDRLLVADGGPRLDLLDGDAIGATGGQPRHELEGQAGYTNNGLGARLSVNYATGTRVNGGTAASPETLRFSGLATANLRLFADFGGRLDWVRAHPWLRGARVTLSFDNLFNERQRVRDATGRIPVSYQPDYLDPLGRSVRLSLRKLLY